MAPSSSTSVSKVSSASTTEIPPVTNDSPATTTDKSSINHVPSTTTTTDIKPTSSEIPFSSTTSDISTIISAIPSISTPDDFSSELLTSFHGTIDSSSVVESSSSSSIVVASSFLSSMTDSLSISGETQNSKLNMESAGLSNAAGLAVTIGNEKCYISNTC